MVLCWSKVTLLLPTTKAASLLLIPAPEENENLNCSGVSELVRRVGGCMFNGIWKCEEQGSDFNITIIN